MVATQDDLAQVPAGSFARPHPARRYGLVAAVAGTALLLLGYLADLAAHPALLNWFDLDVYVQAGRTAAHDPANLYVMVLNYRKFTYTPFAALLFSAVRWVPWLVLTRLVTVASVLALAVVAWLTFGALDWRGARRAGGTLLLAGLAVWLEPVQRALQLGQLEVPLLLLLVWDLCQPDHRRFKGAGIGLAAGIKLVPLIFIPYLLLAGRVRQSVVAAATFAVTAAIGWIFLPGTFGSYWLSGYFMQPSDIGPVGAFRNQSVMGMFIRITGHIQTAQPWWIAASVLIGVAGLGAAAVLHRSGRPVHGWLTCAIAGLLISPVSWDHHWVWIVPLFAVIADCAIRASYSARQAWWTTGAALVLLFGAYPAALHGPDAWVPVGGLLGLVNNRPGLGGVHYHHPSVMVSWDLFVLTGLAILAVMIIGAWRVRRDVPPLAVAPKRAGRTLAS